MKNTPQLHHHHLHELHHNNRNGWWGRKNWNNNAKLEGALKLVKPLGEVLMNSPSKYTVESNLYTFSQKVHV